MSQDSETPTIAKPLLWLAVTHPGLRHAGNQVYSGGLLDALAQRGQAITLLTQDDGPAVSRITVETAALPAFRPRAAGIGSRWPASVWQLAHPKMRRRLHRLLDRQSWRAVVIDQAACGWAAPIVAAHGLPIVYIAHNHEASVRPQVASGAASAFKRAVLRHDAGKYARLEREVVQSASLITAITAQDAAAFAQDSGSARIIELSPGYSGPRVAARTLSAGTPRRVVLVGRFEWIAKQQNLVRWAAEAVAHLAGENIETQVVGTVPDALRQRLEQPGLTFAGRVPDLTPYLANARLGLVAEDVGGGFKLKTLDYIFHRLPVAALADNLAGQPLDVTAACLTAETPAALANAIAQGIDNLERLNQMQQNAFDAAAAAFDWSERAERFMRALESLDRQPPTRQE